MLSGGSSSNQTLAAPIRVQGTARSSSVVPCLFPFDFQRPLLLVLLADMQDDGDSLDLLFFVRREYVVPTGRVVVPTSRYVVPAGKVIIIVSPGRLSLVPTGRVLSPGRVK
ncbi:hypothetical protein Tco_1133832 [Tanacetum coccineum]